MKSQTAVYAINLRCVTTALRVQCIHVNRFQAVYRDRSLIETVFAYVRWHPDREPNTSNIALYIQ